MAARSLQSVTITFGLVTIPVKMYAATNPRAGISFTMLDPGGGRVKQQYISAESGDVVPRNGSERSCGEGVFQKVTSCDGCHGDAPRMDARHNACASLRASC